MDVSPIVNEGPKRQNHFTYVLRHARRVVVFVIGSSIVLVGIALLFLPGPAFVVIPIGLAVLATEFVWARRLLRRARQKAGDVAGALSRKVRS
ncbi:MAG TPA: PGPGW domain-containing protein [Phycisphaerae bacterium]|nr:PGPGW domain-containing protein [Phycisphaerae bacterium]HNU45483.1 PGPGW domain-containing protein [Phycisphaerae bacterium]